MKQNGNTTPEARCTTCTTPLQCSLAHACMEGYVDAPPTSWEELCRRQAYNTRVTGTFEETATHMPCPGCGAKDFLLMPVLTADVAMQQGGTCKECGRGFRFPITEHKCEHGHVHGKSIGMEQTVGPDLPAWFQIPIQRAMQGN